MTQADAPVLTYSSAPGRWVLAITVLGSGIAALDATVVNIALPVIGRDFHTGIAALQWVMNGYTLTLTAFLLIGGSLGDRFGRRKVYLIGILWFALASAACGLAPGAVFLIVNAVCPICGVGVRCRWNRLWSCSACSGDEHELPAAGPPGGHAGERRRPLPQRVNFRCHLQGPFADLPGQLGELRGV